MPGIPLLDINNLSDVSDTATARDNLDVYSKIEITDRLSSSDVDLGDALLGVKKNFTGSIYRTQYDVNNETASIYDFGGLENADNHDALIKAISSGVGRIYIPTGMFSYSGTIDFGGRVIFGDGPNKSQLLAIDDTAIIKIGSGGHLSNLMINGNGSSAATGVGSYGLILPFAQSMLVDNVQVRYFNKYGIILDKSQNSQLIKCNAQYNAVNYLLNNGARNMVISSCNAAMSIDEENGRVSSHRNVLITSITDDNVLSTTTIGQSNSRILIIGGIFEYGNYAQYNIEILHAGRLQQDILMVDVEVTSGEPLLENQYLINLDYGSLGLINPQLNGPDSGKTVRIGEKGRLYVPTDDSFGTSGRGKSSPSNGITVINGGALICGNNTGYMMKAGNNMKGSFPLVAYGNASSVTNDETKRLQTITTTVQNRGARYTWASTTAVLGPGVGFMVEIEVGPSITGIWNVVHGGEVMGSFASPGIYRFIRRMTGGDIDGAVVGIYKSNDDSTSYSCSILGINVGVR